MGVIFSLMLMLPLAEKKLQKSISDDRNNTITEMNELVSTLYTFFSYRTLLLYFFTVFFNQSQFEPSYY